MPGDIRKPFDKLFNKSNAINNSTSNDLVEIIDNLYNEHFIDALTELTNINVQHDNNNDDYDYYTDYYTEEDDFELLEDYTDNELFEFIQQIEDTNNVETMYCKYYGEQDLDFIRDDTLIDFAEENDVMIELVLQDLTITNHDLSFTFENCEMLKSITIKNNIVNCQYLNGLFQNCENLEECYISLTRDGQATNQVLNMSKMFKNCKKLRKVVFENIDTSQCTDMSSMFEGCISLVELDLTMFDTSNVRNMSHMFDNCCLLEDLDIHSFNTSNVRDMSYMFRNCKSMEAFELNFFDTSNVRNMSYMFADCINMEACIVYEFNIDNLVSSYGMFRNCDKLQFGDISMFNV